MTDERYAFVEDVKNRKNLAKSGGKKGKSKYGCTLPSDYMTTKEKRTANSQWVSITYDRPISFNKFLAYSDEDKKIYLQTLIDTYGGDTGKIAKIFKCEESKIKVFRQNLGIQSASRSISNLSPDSLWKTFLTFSDFLYNPMSYEDFKKMDIYDQQEHINFLQSEFNLSLRNLASLYFNISKTALINYINKFKISYISKKPGAAGHLTDEETKKFYNWLGFDPEEIKEKEPEMKDNTSDIENISQVAVPDANEPIEQPITAESVAEIPSMQVSLRIDSMDQIIEMVKKLPRAKQGRLYFVWGGE